MKQLKGSTPIKGKRKLNNEETDSSTKPVGVAKRTRSSGSLVSENVPKRSTRSAQIDSFMEIPNYPQRKVNSDPESPLRRSKRLSTCSSTSSDPDDSPNIPRIQDHPRRSPRALRISDASKSDVAQNGNGSPAKCSRTKTNRSLSLSQNGVNNTIPNNDLHNGVKQESKPLKKATENGGTPTDEKRQQEIKTDILNSNLEKLRNGNGICQQRVSQRKRHFTQDLFTPELRRQRRMSERGEMASVMEFVFNHKKSIHKSPKQSRSKKPDKRKPTTTSPAKSEPGVSNSNPGIENLNLELKINKIKTSEIEEVASKSDETPPKIAKTISEEENLNERSVLDDSGKISDENCQNADFAENNIEIKSSENTVNDCLSNQSLSPYCDGVSEEMHCENKVHISKPTISIEEEEEHFMKWRKRELRSSGIKCQPDYYALSLDLMIHRTRTPKKRVEKK
uniref:Uncharacterized protein n=1 Tax=Ciona savignyi TaxID=51511 RepID=H2Y8R2_CIOSA